jgi:GH15 family glucan-1,4-alpha-glucosidase
MPHLDLAPVGNCAVASLIDRQGRHVWFCFPRLDGDPVFNALINGGEPKAGFMDVRVAGQTRCRQTYLPNTAILETILETGAGEQVRIVDFAPRFQQFGRLFHPPMLVRRIEPLSGQPRITIRIRPTFGYGSTEPSVSVGSNHVRFVGGDSVLRVTADIGPTYYLDEASFLLTRPVSLFIGSDEGIPEEPDSLAQRFLHNTTSYWMNWVRELAIPFEWQDAVIRSAIGLKLCSYDETGAIVAALTTSVPESPGTVRNWDYRYCWLRDSYFTVNALNRLGATRTMENYTRFVLNNVVREGSSELAPLYPIVSRTTLEETQAASLAGYRNMGPVRIGNAAYTQRQNDVYGSIILSAAQIFWDARIPSIGSLNLYQKLRPLGETALQMALTHDASLWEYRERNAVFTYSAAMCWAAAHRLSLIAARVGATGDAAYWHEKAAALQQTILQRAITPEGWISGILDGEMADASVLLLAQIGIISPASDPFRRTLEVIESRLLVNGFVRRYAEADDFGVSDTAFIVCTFWYIDALHAMGRQTEARELFANLLSKRNAAGLLPEDVDPRSGELWGNYPQTYSLVGLSLSAHRLSRTWEQGLWNGS